MRLYSYWRSTAAYRVRIVLNLKSVAHEIVAVNLVDGMQFSQTHQSRNTMHSVPVLEIEEGKFISQSLAIIEYLEAEYDAPKLMPDDAWLRAKILEVVQIIIADIHPINNLRVLKKLEADFGADGQARQNWMKHFMNKGFVGFQSAIADTGPYAFGEALSLADIALVPQLYNARRWELDLAPFKRLIEIEQNCLALEAFDKARPENQIDAQ